MDKELSVKEVSEILDVTVQVVGKYLRVVCGLYFFAVLDFIAFIFIILYTLPSLRVISRSCNKSKLTL